MFKFELRMMGVIALYCLVHFSYMFFSFWLDDFLEKSFGTLFLIFAIAGLASFVPPWVSVVYLGVSEYAWYSRFLIFILASLAFSICLMNVFSADFSGPVVMELYVTASLYLFFNILCSIPFCFWPRSKNSQAKGN